MTTYCCHGSMPARNPCTSATVPVSLLANSCGQSCTAISGSTATNTGRARCSSCAVGRYRSSTDSACCCSTCCGVAITAATGPGGVYPITASTVRQICSCCCRTAGLSSANLPLTQ